MPLLLLKLTLVPGLIVLITLAGRRWGAHIAGWLSAFPVVAGPILFFIAMEKGVSFASMSALGMFTAIAANIFFGLCYAWLATRFSWFFAWPCALLAYAMMVGLINNFSLVLWQAILLNLATMLLVPYFYPQLDETSEADANEAEPKHSPIELPLRMLAGAVLVFAVTHFSDMLGSRLSGMMAMFPVMASVLAVFSHRNLGKAFAIQLLRGALLGWYAFSMFSFLMAVGLPVFGVAGAFALATVFALVVQTISLSFVRKLQDDLEFID